MKWIKFSERWPEKGQSILYYDHIRDIFEVVTCRDTYSLEENCGCLIPGIDDNRDYWMPLPEKPNV